MRFIPMAKRIRWRCIYMLALALICIGPVNPAPAQNRADPSQGLEIMKKSMDRLYVLEDQAADLTFTLIDDNGRESRTELSLFWKNYRGQDGIRSKMLLVTNFPPSERGEAFLIWEYQQSEQSQFWMYIPELRQTRKIQRPSPGDALRESDLVFEDMRGIQLDRMDFELIKESIFEGEGCYVIEAKSIDRSTYGKRIFWISKISGAFLKIEYYDPKQRLIKTQTVQWQDLKGNLVWRNSMVKNLQMERTTRIELNHIRVNADLPDDLFTERSLNRGMKK